MDQHDSQDLLTSGSTWFNGNTNKLVTVLVLTNQGVGPKFLAANPAQVVFITDKGIVISQNVEHFLKKHTFFNVLPEVENVITKLLAGDYSEDSAEEGDAEVEQEAAPEAPKAIDAAAVAKAAAVPLDLTFLTLEDDDRADSKVTSKALVKEVISLDQSPVIVNKDGGIVMAGSMFSITLRGWSEKSEQLVQTLFDPLGATKHFAGLAIGDNVSPVTFLGTTVSQDSTGKHLVINLASLEEEDEAQEEDAAEGEQIIVPVAEEEQSLDAIAEALSATPAVEVAAAAHAPQGLQIGVSA